MGFSVNTNIASLQAQNYLRTSSDFQAKTINRVTSGLRIVSSGDDAAGLAIANGFRSDEAVLTQGIRNANDGLSTLQTIDGGMNNISQLLDRARTLATQSASGTFTGGAAGRAQLNSEFQSVLTEIDRQAQSIGLNQGGEFAKALSVFIGGGKGTSAAGVISNGSVSVDLSNSKVDTTALGLNSLQAKNSSYDLGANSATSVTAILQNATNTGSEASAGQVQFTFTGAGFADSNAITVDVNVAGVKDTESLVNAINSAIETAASGSSTQATAFKNAGVSASIVTDADGRQQLSFSAPNAAFQVKAGDQAANALLGNFEGTGPAGRTLQTYSIGNTVPAAATAGTAKLVINGVGLDVTINNNDTVDDIVTAFNTAITAAGTDDAIEDKFTAYAENGKIRVENLNGDSFTLTALDKYSQTATGFTAGTHYSSTFGDTSTAAGGGTATDIDINGVTLTMTVTQDDTVDDAVTAFNTAIAAAGADDAIENKFVAYNDGGKFAIASVDGSAFTLQGSANSNTFLGIGTTEVSVSNVLGESTQANSVAAGGAQVSGQYGDNKAYTWTAFTGGNSQDVTFAGVHADGSQYNWSTTLNGSNASTLDNAIATINDALQASSDSSLKKIVAVKDADSNGALGIRFMSSDAFSVKLGTSSGTAGQGLKDSSTGAINNGQGAILLSGESAGSGGASIDNQTAAQAAVSALATAVSTLGNAQAVVGKGQNNFNFAVNLAQSQLTNLAAAESRIRDADLAAEAANLSKAQILIQAGTAALAQANSAPQAILSLLRG